MRFARSKQFERSYQRLPAHVQKKMRKALRLLAAQESPPYHPSLVIKKIKGSDGIWEGRVDLYYRFTFDFRELDGETICFLRNVGGHDITATDP
jgi:mRNA-degrading endonuclease RelE of RelBE toxin-antitoxin system